jgi:hypothetical protein
LVLMAKRTLENDTSHDELLAAELAADPDFAADWERLAVTRTVAA